MIHAVLSSQIRVGFFYPKLSRRRSARRYKTSHPVANAEWYSVSAVESAVVFCIFDFQMIGDLLCSMTMPDVDLRE